MTKEEILKKFFGDADFESSDYELEAMDFFAEQECVGFADWIDGCMYSKVYDDKQEDYIEWTDGGEIIAKSTKELYQLYLKSKSNNS